MVKVGVTHGDSRWGAFCVKTIEFARLSISMLWIIWPFSENSKQVMWGTYQSPNDQRSGCPCYRIQGTLISDFCIWCVWKRHISKNRTMSDWKKL